MGSDGVSEVGAGAGEGVDGMVNGTSLSSGSIAGPGAGGDGRCVGAEINVHNELAEGVRRSWVEGSEERMWKPSLRICLRR